jgi:hypothetical protein
MTFLGENHVNVVRVRAGIEPVIPAEELCDQLNQPETAAAVRLLTGNTQLSATELTHLLPVAA